jgi:hypothetical protein
MIRQKYNLSKDEINAMALDYVYFNDLSSEIACNYLSEKAAKSRKLYRFLNKAVEMKLVEKYQYEDAVERRKFHSLMGRHFSEDKKKDLYKLNAHGYKTINEKRKELADEVIRQISDGNYKANLRNYKSFSESWGMEVYGKKVSKTCISEAVTAFIEKRVLDKRVQLVRYFNSLLFIFQTHEEKQMLGKLGAEKRFNKI